MEAKVTIIKQWPATEREITRRDGSKLTITNIDLEMTVGVDRIKATAEGTIADVLKGNPLKEGGQYMIGLEFSIIKDPQKEDDHGWMKVMVNRYPVAVHSS